jgi:hypothetical protein
VHQQTAICYTESFFGYLKMLQKLKNIKQSDKVTMNGENPERGGHSLLHETISAFDKARLFPESKFKIQYHQQA